jgi:hypothetical protein
MNVRNERENLEVGIFKVNGNHLPNSTELDIYFAHLVEEWVKRAPSMEYN